MNLTRAELEQHVLQLMPAWRSHDLGDFDYLDGGYSNLNYRFGYRDAQYVLRVPQNGDQPFVDRHREVALLAALPTSLPPTLVQFDSTSGRMITRWLDGDLLVDLSGHDPAAVARSLRTVHERLPDTDVTYDPLEMSRRYLAIADTEVPDSLLRLSDKKWQPANETTCHNDLNPWNVIVSDLQDWRVIDWEVAGRNDPLFDLVTLVLGLELDEGWLARCASQFEAAPPAPVRLESCIQAFWLREYAWAAAQCAHGNTRPEIVEQMERSCAQLVQRLT